MTASSDTAPQSDSWRRWPKDEKLRLLERLKSEQAHAPAGPPKTPLDLGKLVFGDAFISGRHTEYLNQKLLQVAEGSIDRLMVFCPPRHFKSESCSHFFPAWFLGMNPDARVMLAGYGAEFAEEWGRKTRNTLEEFGHLFGVAIDPRRKAAPRWDLERRRGGMYASGIGGSMTGRGADLLVIDDPVKDAEHAFSALQRKRVYEWYQAVALTRLAPGGRVVLIQTRWHSEDLAGKLLAAQAAGGDRWEVINFPAIAEEDDVLGRRPGEPLFPERYDTEALNRIRAAQTNDFWWWALYQQRPPSEMGSVIDVDLFRGYTHRGDFYIPFDELDGGRQLDPVHPRDCERITVVDCAASSEDVVKEMRGRAPSHSVVATFDVSPGGQFFWRDLQRGLWNFPELLDQTELAYRQQQPAWIGVEDEKTGRALWQTLQPKGYNVRALATEGKDKLTRAAEFLNRLKQRQVYIGRDAPWRKDLLSEMIFWTGHPDDPADQIDAVAYACREWQRGHAGMTVVVGKMGAGELSGGGLVRGW